MPTVYLDYAATAPIRPEVRRAMRPFLGESFGNPSSAHDLGAEADRAVEKARECVARLLGATPGEIVFTSGGTESINLALQGVAMARGEAGHLVTTAVEHPATLETARFLRTRGWEVTFVPVDSHGLVDPDDVRVALTPRTALVSVMHANNEVGTLQPIEEIARVASQRGVPVHVDAVQTAGKLPLAVKRMGVDLLSLSGHKLGGPKGVGALYIRAGTAILPLLQGGGQERGLRGGTENVAGIAGFGAAAGVSAREMLAEGRRVAELRDRLSDGVLQSVEGVHPMGHPTRRLPGFAHFCFEGLDGHWLVKELSRAGVRAATGSACSSGKSEPSHVLSAMGVPADLAQGALRLTLGWGTTAAEAQFAIIVLPRVVERLRAGVAAGTNLAAEYATDCREARRERVAELLRTGWSRLTGRR